MVSDNDLALLALRAGQRLLGTERRAATVESCTGGYVAKLLTDVPGSSQWFDCGYVTYSNVAKQRDVGVLAQTLQQHGAVSEATVREMARGAIAVTGANVAVSISGVAGPDGGSEHTPVGTVWFCLSGDGDDPDEAQVHRQHFSGDRDAVRRQAAAFALHLLCDC